MSPFLMYCMLMADNFLFVAFAVFFVYVVAYFIIWALQENGYPEEKSTYQIHLKKMNRFCFIPIFCLLFLAFVPGTNKLMMLYFVPKIANNEAIQDISEDSIKVIQKKLTEMLGEK